MANVTLAGTPAIRYPDPLVRQVSPQGLQPASAFDAPFVWLSDPAEKTYSANLQTISGAFFSDLLLFCSDYPAIVRASATYYAGGYFSNPNAPPSALPVPQSTVRPFPYISPSHYAGGRATIGKILSNSENNPTTYKKIVSGKTITNQVNVSGFSWGVDSGSFLLQSSADLTGESAVFSVDLSVIANGAVIDGPSPFSRYATTRNYEALPVIMWENHFTQEIVDNNFIIKNATFNISSSPVLVSSMQVVGIWQVETPAYLIQPPAP
jgi:hypothetical protein